MMRLPVSLFLMTLLTFPFSSPAYALTSAESMLTQARQHLQNGNYSFATTWLQCLLRNYPKTHHRQEALLLLAKAAGSSGRGEKAVQYAAELLQEFPDEAAALDPELLKQARLAPQPEPVSRPAAPAPLPEPVAKMAAKSSPPEAKAETPAAIPAAVPAVIPAAIPLQPAEAAQPAIKTLPPAIETASSAVQSPKPAKAPTHEPVAGGGNGFYTLVVGESVNRKKIAPLLKKLKAGGLQPVIRQEMKGRDVYRLVVACCNDSQSAREQLSDVARKVKEAFIAHEGDSYCIVAGSLLSAEAAERGRQQLAGRGVPAKVVKAQVRLPVWRASVGNYADAREAAGTAKKLAALAIEATLEVVRK